MIKTKVKPRKIEILLVENSPSDRRRAIEALRASRVVNTVHPVADGDAAMRFLRHEGEYGAAPVPDLILLNQNLPGKAGREVLAEVKGDEVLQHTPVVLLAASREDEDVLGAESGLIDGCITKPLDFAKFSKVIASLEDFWFEVVTLPTEAADRVSMKLANRKGASRHRAKARHEMNNYRALVVEDSPTDRILIEAALSENSRSVFETTVLDEVGAAKMELEGGRYDVVVADLGLTESGSLDAVRSLVKSAAGVPVVVLTALEDDDFGHAAIKEGAADFVSKGELSGRVLGRTIRYAVDRSRIEEQMRHSQRMESLGILAGGIAHDFNNLLMVIRGNAELQRRFAGDDARLNRTSGQVLDAADRAARLTRQMLAFGRRERVQLCNIELNATIREFIKMIERLMGPTIDLKVSLIDEPLAITGDASLLEQVIMNLAVNARDAMPDGGTLEICSERVAMRDDQFGEMPPAGPGDYAKMTVRDSGGGIPPEIIGRIFEPFFTTKNVGRGTGLGLSTTYGIVRQHRGSIEVDSQEGDGSTFTVLIPCTRHHESAKAGNSDVVPAGNNETILVVDDEAMVRDLTASFLAMNGYQVEQAESGADVIRRWSEFESRVDLVLTDLIMPEGVSGRDLGTWLFEHKPDLKVIYCSGFSRPHLNRKFKLREGMNFLAKPYSVNSLLKLVHHVLHPEPSKADAARV